MKLINSFGRMILFVAVLFSAPRLEAQYTFTSLDLLSSNTGGTIAVSGSNAIITFMDQEIGTTSFLYRSAGSYTLVDNAAFGPRTSATAIDGTNVVGCCEDNASVFHGFLYSGGVFTVLTYPAAVNTTALGISGTSIVGSYQDASNISHGFLYNITTKNFTPISFSGATDTEINAISGNNIVGTYKDTSGVLHGFVYNSGVYTAINYTGADQTGVIAVSGNNVVGSYQFSHRGVPVVGHGFLYNSGTYTNIIYPGSYQTVVTGVSGNTVIGTYILSGGNRTNGIYSNFDTIPHGFTYTSGTYKTFDVPGARRTALVGISGSNIVGAYEDINFIYHGFLAVPSTKTMTLGTGPAFGNVAINTPATATLTIKNTGNTPLTVNNITYPTGFSGSWTGALGPGSVENLTVTFTPTAVQSYSGNITVTSTATGSPMSVAVSGAGVNPLGSSIARVVGPTPVTYTEWVAQNALVTASPAATPLNDGVPNLLKYLYDISPTQTMSASDQAAMAVVGVDSTTNPGVKYLTLTYRKNALAEGLAVNLQTSTDLTNWTTVTPDINQQTVVGSGGDPMIEVGVTASSVNRQFIRLNVTAQ